MYQPPLWLATILVVVCSLGGCNNRAEFTQALPSWNNTPQSQRLYQFITEVSDKNSTSFVDPADRIAVFDNDGTLWAEQPAYFQLFFAIDRIKALAEADPYLKQQWSQQQPFKAALEGDLAAIAASGEKGLLQLVMASHTGHDVATTEEFRQQVKQWIDTATHPITGKRYTDMVYQPMLELLNTLRAHDFKIYVVSGGGIDFMRSWVEDIYGVPPENVIGSQFEVEYEYRNGNPVLLQRPAISHLNDKAQKPIAIHTHIGKRPILAFGNSDGDLQMLQWTHANALPNLAVYIHHTDAEREWAYDRESSIGRLKQGLKQAEQDNWLVISMKDDWRQIFPNTAH